MTSTGEIQPAESVVFATEGAPLQMGDQAWLQSADYARAGGDLIVTGADGVKVVVVEYFSLENPPDIIADNGATFSADLISDLAGPLAPGQFAQAAPAGAAEAIGRVDTVTGVTTVTRADGTQSNLQSGDQIFQGDVLVTGNDGSLSLIMADDSIFSLAGDGRMVMDEASFDPGTEQGKLAVSLVQGVFSFVSGKIAKTDPDAMVLTTPVALIGVRGTTGVLDLPPGGQVTIALAPNADGTTGEMTVQATLNGVPFGPPATLNVPLQAVTAAAGGQISQPFTIPAAQFQQQFGGIVQQAQSSASSVGNTGGQTGQPTQGDPQGGDDQGGDGDAAGDGDQADAGDGDGGDGGDGDGEDGEAEGEAEAEAEAEAEEEAQAGTDLAGEAPEGGPGGEGGPGDGGASGPNVGPGFGDPFGGGFDEPAIAGGQGGDDNLDDAFGDLGFGPEGGPGPEGGGSDENLAPPPIVEDDDEIVTVVVAPTSNIVNLGLNFNGSVELSSTVPNTIIGSSGGDTVTFVGSTSSGDTFDGGSGTDMLTLDDGGNNIVLVGTESLVGGSGSDIVTVSGSPSLHMSGGAGDDTLTGGSSADTINGNAGNDVISGAGGSDTLFASAGNDSLTGQATNTFGALDERDIASYSGATSGVTATVSSTVTVTGDSSIGTDTLTNIDIISGSSFADTYTADSNFVETFVGGFTSSRNIFNGQGGNDTITGNGDTSIAFRQATAGVTASLASGTATGDSSVGTDTFTGVDRIGGSDFADVLTGTNTNADGREGFQGHGGNDTIDGGSGGGDGASYASATAGVTVNLSLGSDQAIGDSSVGTDTLISIENIRGSDFADILTGDSANNEIQGGKGNDTIDGGSGRDDVSYQSDIAGVTVDLSTGTATDGFGSIDTLSNFQDVRGSNFDDVLTGDSANNAFRGMGGNDTIDGGTGTDRVEYFLDDSFGGTGNATIDLGAGTAIDGFGNTDTLISIESVFGSDANDTITGDANGNLLDGRDGNDTINGAGGVDTYTGGVGNDTFFTTATGGFDLITDFTGADDSLNLNDEAGGFSYSASLNRLTDVLPGQTNVSGLTFAAGTGMDDVNFGEVNAGSSGGHLISIVDNSSGITGSSQGDLIVFAGTTAAKLASGGDGNDRYQDFSGNANTFSGGAGNDRFQGFGGADSFDGGAGTDFAAYNFDASAGGSAGISGSFSSITDGFGAVDTLTNVEGVVGTASIDIITAGSGGFHAYEMLGGNDTITGGGGNDEIRFDVDGASGVTVNLSTGTAIDTTGATDSFSAIEYARGTVNADTFVGDTNFNRFKGLGGADNFDGGTGLTALDYSDDAFFGGTAGITAVFSAANSGTVTDGFGAIDTFSNVDEILGTSSVDLMTGTTGNQEFAGLGGADSFVGGAGIDTVVYEFDSREGGTAGVTVNLASGTATDGFGSIDTFTGIESVAGTAAVDVITGSTTDDFLFGGASADTLSGGDGNDTFEIEGASDLVSGEIIIGGNGTDKIRIDSNFGSSITSLDFTGTAVSGVETIDVTGGSAAGVTITTGVVGSVTSILSDGTNDQLTFTASVSASGVTADNIKTVNLSDGVSLTVDSTTSANALVTFNGTSGGSSETVIVSSGNQDFDAITFTNIATISLTQASTAQTLTIDAGTVLNGTNISGTGGDDILSSLTGMDLSSGATTLTNIASVLLDTDNTEAATLTVSESTVLNGGNATAITGTGSNDIVSSLSGMDLSTVTLSNIATVQLDSDNAGNTSGATNLLVDSSTNFNGATVAGGATTNHVHIVSNNGMDVSGMTLFSGISTASAHSLLLDNDTATSNNAAVLTLNASTNLTGGTATTVEIFALEGGSTNNDDIITSTNGMNLGGALVQDVATINVNSDNSGTDTRS